MFVRPLMRTAIVAAAVASSIVLFSPDASAGSGQLTGITTANVESAKGDELLLSVTASALQTSWATAGSESAVVSVSVDGAFKTDIVLYRGDQEFTYNVFLGQLGGGGSHTVALAYNETKSTAGAAGANVVALIPQVVSAADPSHLVVKHAPILYGRSLFWIFENNRSDTPELMYHTLAKDGAGNTTIEYTVVYSNEDGGSGANDNIGPLMARWGRSTDIEWAYRVTIDKRGRVKSQQYHGDNHATINFTGLKEANHPLLYIKTIYNSLGQVTNPASGYRFSNSPLDTIATGRAREQAMDNRPESYWVMAVEAIREGAIKDPEGDPATAAVSDLRNYLYVELSKRTSYATTPASGSWVGVAIAVQLKGDSNWYTSHHGDASWSIQRDGPASTTAELLGTTRLNAGGTFTANMVQAIKVFPVRYGTPPSYTVTFTAINRAFFLDAGFQPQGSFVTVQTGITLTGANEADGVVVWGTEA